MGFSMRTNVSALSAQRHLRGSAARMTQAFNRLSSGQRIQHAGDDPTGLIISARFTQRIRGERQAMDNAQSAASMARGAEASLDSVGALLQAIRPLVIQAANDSQSQADRLTLQGQIDALREEINAVVTRAEFNGQPLLDGSLSDAFFNVGPHARQRLSFGVRDVQVEALGAWATAQGNPASSAPLVAGDLSINGVAIRPTQPQDDPLSTSNPAASAIAKAAAINASVADHGVTARVLPTVLEAAGPITAGPLDEIDALWINGVLIGGFEVLDDDANHALMTAINDVVDQTGVSASINAAGHLVLRAEDGRNINVEAPGNAAAITGLPAAITQQAALNLASAAPFALAGNGEAVIGFADNQAVVVNADEALDTLSVLSQEAAEWSILKLDRALEQINGERAKLGAVINRLEATLGDLNAQLGLDEAARAHVADADFAAEASALSQAQILQQSGLSILAQANSAREGALRLLEG